jgi:hypothetical protein
MDIVRQLQSFAALKKGWDSYSAEPPTVAAVNESIIFIRSISSTPTRVAPSAIGGIGITFRKEDGDRKVYVEFRNEGVNYAMYDDDIKDSDPHIEKLDTKRFDLKLKVFFSELKRC